MESFVNSWLASLDIHIQCSGRESLSTFKILRRSNNKSFSDNSKLLPPTTRYISFCTPACTTSMENDTCIRLHSQVGINICTFRNARVCEEYGCCRSQVDTTIDVQQ